MRISYSQIALLVLFAILLASGQILFKLTAKELLGVSGGQNFVARLLQQPVFWLACLVYGLTTVLWIWLLIQVPLSLAYPFVTLALVIVPIVGWLWFSEPLNTQYWIGMSLIIVGTTVIVQS